METQELKIRDLPKDVVKKIDRLAKKNNMKRSEFCKKALDNLIEYDLVSSYEYLFEELIKKNTYVLDLNTKVLRTFCDENIIDLDKFILE
ncbi:Uncharacterised protein [[Clostridium] sordellii]|uniref:Ribbon-helix-helix, copG family protein n=1 Tax=Paraclostridium sordellii TaxID=1505 RepID=A0ABM9RTS3_PARSO|nr:hypothetical protein [Paeniclostridium sordellii]TAN64058.1 hypothetical protein WS9_014970 [Paeniclostridium sordellii 8483]CEJ75500.1 ribbon-helix-helix, copG family protein (plasmid) [[Clostridium] sordellii] [Paeniclostridium sordellii]CEN22457.1 Uncharacterised protein [[Clostridium] sordellii] [Paeniclostridium sordellii]CEN29738.1 Uncharacterised protein [[Clostridium] sordellii] [Paeniclostridium sordellii]